MVIRRSINGSLHQSPPLTLTGRTQIEKKKTRSHIHRIWDSWEPVQVMCPSPVENTEFCSKKNVKYWCEFVLRSIAYHFHTPGSQALEADALRCFRRTLRQRWRTPLGLRLLWRALHLPLRCPALVHDFALPRPHRRTLGQPDCALSVRLCPLHGQATPLCRWVSLDFSLSRARRSSTLGGGTYHKNGGSARVGFIMSE